MRQLCIYQPGEDGPPYIDRALFRQMRHERLKKFLVAEEVVELRQGSQTISGEYSWERTAANICRMPALLVSLIKEPRFALKNSLGFRPHGL